MMNPNSKLVAGRSASVTAGTALPASVSVAITEPGPTRTNAAVPNASASARCDIECILPKAPLYLTSVRQCRTDFTNRSPAQVVCQQLIWSLAPTDCRSPSVQGDKGASRPTEWIAAPTRFHIDTGQITAEKAGLEVYPNGLDRLYPRRRSRGIPGRQGDDRPRLGRDLGHRRRDPGR